MISFSVGEEEYGLELLCVKEVIRMREITWLPKAPPCVKGIINLRGDVIPIVDLREKFGLVAQEQTAMTGSSWWRWRAGLWGWWWTLPVRLCG